MIGPKPYRFRCDGGDAELAQQHEGGSADALQELCQKHYEPLYGLVRGLVRVRSGRRPPGELEKDAKDCTQETFARFIRSFERWKNRDRCVMAYLTVIAKNTVTDQYGDALHHDSGAQASLDGIPDLSPDEIRQVQARQTLERVLRPLGEPCRTLLLIHVAIREQTAKEIAAELGEPYARVRQRLYRCVRDAKRLREELDRQ